MTREELLRLAAHKRNQAARFKALLGGRTEERTEIVELVAEFEQQAVRLEAEAAAMDC